MNRENRIFNSFSLLTGKTVLVAVAYILSSLLGYLFTSTSSPLPIIWPQAGVALALTLLIGSDALPGILIGSFSIAIASGIPITFSLIVAVGNTLAAFFGGHFILARNDFSYTLDNMSSIFKFFLIGVLFSPVISATISILGMLFMQINIGEDLPLIWETRWLREALGVLVFTPIIIVWFGNPLPKFSKKSLIEGAAILFTAISFVSFIFFERLNHNFANTISFLIIPIIFWAAIRLDIHGLILINFCSSVLFLWGVTNHMGVFFVSDLSSNLSYFFILSTMWITSLILSSSISKYQKAQRSLSDLSNHDALTNLYNRLFFDTELNRLDKSRQFPISIIMADVDGLKEVNDLFGHFTGDQVLKNVAGIFSSVFRQEDIISRIGGDEFVVLLPGTGASEVKMIIERMNNRIDAYNIENHDLPINISLGVSTANQGEPLSGHLKIADDLMYEEKERKKAVERIPYYFQTQKAIDK